MIRVHPVIEIGVRGLCIKPYEGHKKGCPNFGDPKHSHRCPPNAPLFNHYFDLSLPVYAVINCFDLAAHVERMRESPTTSHWTEKQLRCCLYWQGKARKQLKEKIVEALAKCPPYYEATWCPEGMGVNVTETLRRVGIELEWPPTRIVRQVAFLAYHEEGI